MKKLLFLFTSMAILFSCTPPAGEAESAPEEEGPYAIGSDENVEKVRQGFNLMSSFDFDAWGELLSDDVQYVFPDGAPDARTTLDGKDAVLAWWNDWRENAGITALTFSDEVMIPIDVSEALNYTGLTGEFVMTWLSTRIDFTNGNSASFRMNTAAHFDENGLIDAYYTYYDRSGIIEAMGRNILEE